MRVFIALFSSCICLGITGCGNNSSLWQAHPVQKEEHLTYLSTRTPEEDQRIKQEMLKKQQEEDAKADLQPGFEFKGVKLGTSEDRVRIKLRPIACRSGDGVLADRECFFSSGTTYAELPAVRIVAAFYADQLAAVFVQVRQEYFEQDLESLKSKYGGPAETKVTTVTNALGASLPKASYYWHREGTTILAESLAGDLREAQFIYVQDSAAQELAKRREQSAGQRKHDL
jgi:hypothetical protein